MFPMTYLNILGSVVGIFFLFFKEVMAKLVFFPTILFFFYIQITVQIDNRCGILGIFIMLYGLHVGSVEFAKFHN